MPNWMLGNYTARLNHLVKADEVALSSAQRTEAVQIAVERFSGAFSREVAAEIEGDGGRDYDLPDTWVADFSQVDRIEFPAGEFPPQYLEPQEWRIYRGASGLKIRFCRNLEAGQTAILVFNVMHEVTEEAGTISPAWNNAVCFCASEIACNMVAGHFAQTGESTWGADGVAHRSKSQEYRAQAGRWSDLYEEELEKAPTADSIQGDLDIPAPGGDRPPVFRRFRGRRQD